MNTAIAFNNTDLASRSAAAKKRAEIESWLSTSVNDTIISVDLSGVESISGSYADELFGVLAQKLGEEAFIQRFKFIRAKNYCLTVIAECVITRTSSGSEAT